MHANSIPPSLMLVCWRYRRTPSLPSWLSPHRDATWDRIMHFSWGGECECAGCSSSVWAMFCSVNTYSFLWFDCLFLERQTSLVNNHVSSWDFFSIRCQPIIAILAFSFFFCSYFKMHSSLLHMLYNQRVSMHFSILYTICSVQISLNTFEDGGQFLIFCVNDAMVNWTTSCCTNIGFRKTQSQIHKKVGWVTSRIWNMGELQGARLLWKRHELPIKLHLRN